MKTINLLISIFIIGILFTITGCSDDIESANPPTSEDAIFSYSFDPENPNKVYFTAEPAVSTWYIHWSFGDNTSYDLGLETSKVFTKKGDYEVEFKIFTEGGTASYIQTVTIESDFEGPNILRNGDFSEGNEFWSVLPISDGVDVSMENNNAQWTGGGWGQVGIYQAVHVLANNTYQITLDIKGGPLSDSWFEVYIGMEPPVAGQDYTDGGMRMALNTWEGCGNEPFEGPFADYSCVGSGATFEFPTEGTAYFVIRGGGADYGDAGVTVDNIAIRSLESTDPPIFPSPGAPVANFTAVTSSLSATFTNTSVNATSYVWDFGDGIGTSTETDPAYTYTQEGTYTVKLTATNGDESAEFTNDITVSEVAVSTSIQNGDFADDSVWTIIKQNASENGKLTIADGVAVFDEAIDVASGDWGNEAHMGMYQAVAIEAGDYKFDMDITTKGIDEAWFEVWVGTSMPIDGVEYKDDVGATKVLSFNAWDCGDTNKTYSGKMADASCQDTDGTISLEAGTYYILIRSGGFNFGEGGIVIDNVTMEDYVISTDPIADFTFETADLAATFTNASSDATSYAWDFGDNTGTSTDENPVYTYTVAGTYNVKLTATNDQGSNEITKEVTISAAVILPVADFTAETTDLAAAFTNTSSDATSYAWDFGDDTGTSTDENPVYTYTVAGTYNVKLTATNDQGSNEITKEVTVSEAVATPIADFTFETADLAATFVNTSSNATSYAWDFGDETGTSTDENPSYTYAEAGTYTVKLTATSDQGSNEITKDITVAVATDSNLITNGTFDDATGWTVINQYETTNVNGSVTIADGVAKFDETTAADWKHMGIYTAVELTAGTYQFDMHMTYTEISDVWGEVYIGASQPVEGDATTGIEYSGDQQVIKAYNAWDCGDIKTYSGLATAAGCDTKENPGQFEITADGTYYLLFRTGGGTYGTTGIVIDNVTLVKTN